MEIKKWLALALAGTMCFSMLAACGGDEEYVEDEEEYVEDEYVEDEDVEDGDYEDEEPAEEDEELPDLTEQEQILRLGQINALLIAAMQALDEATGGEENYPEDVLAILEDMKADVMALSEMDPQTMDPEVAASGLAAFESYLNVVLQYVEIDAEAVLAEAGLLTSDSVDGPVSDKAWDTMNSMLELMNKLVLYFQENGAPGECGPYLEDAVAILTGVSGAERTQFTEMDAAKLIGQMQPICEFLSQYIPMEE